MDAERAPCMKSYSRFLGQLYLQGPIDYFFLAV